MTIKAPATFAGRPCPPAPSDEACGKAWDQIIKIAQAHALIVQAYSGVATLAIPEEQRKADVRETVLAAHCMTETR